MSATHTPGPWGIAPADEWRTASGQHAQFGEFRIDAGSYRVATVSNANNDAQNKANAALIASAPDLLDMAECLRAVCARIIEQYGPVQCGIDFAALGGRVNQVLAEAEGQQ